MHLESQLNVERTRVETEKKKGVALEEQLRLAVSLYDSMQVVMF